MAGVADGYAIISPLEMGDNVKIKFLNIDITTHDLGWQVWGRFKRKNKRPLMFNVHVPIPLEWGTIKYSLRHQGLFKSLINLFHCQVPTIYSLLFSNTDPEWCRPCRHNKLHEFENQSLCVEGHPTCSLYRKPCSACQSCPSPESMAGPQCRDRFLTLGCFLIEIQRNKLAQGKIKF